MSKTALLERIHALQDGAMQATEHVDEQMTLQQLQRTYAELEQRILQRCQTLWQQGEEQAAYELFVQYEQPFAPKIALATALTTHCPDEEVVFFGDTYPLRDIDPIELALHYTTEELEQLAMLYGVEEDEEEPLANYELHMDIASRLYELVNKYGLLQLQKPIRFHFLKDAYETLVYEHDVRTLQAVLRTVIEQTNHPLEPIDERLLRAASEPQQPNEAQATANGTQQQELETTSFVQSVAVEAQKAELAEQLFMLAHEKGVKLLHEPVNVRFELDDADDIAAVYTVEALHEALGQLHALDVRAKVYAERLNTLDVARKYLHGRISEEQEEDWRSYAPSSIKAQIKRLSLREAYDIVLQKSKEKGLSKHEHKLVMDYRFELEALIFGERAPIVTAPNYETFKDYPFEEYVRQTVESIILPHIEVLEQIEQRGGQILFVDIWAQHFSDELKQRVRERDGFKCVICDEETHLHVHHKVPRKLGGVNHMDNLVTLCASCHKAVETADFDYAYQKCMGNAIKAKTSLQKAVDTTKEIYLLKEEVKGELEAIYYKVNAKDEALGSELLAAMKKIDYIFDAK